MISELIDLLFKDFREFGDQCNFMLNPQPGLNGAHFLWLEKQRQK